jgi:hypothetical protein
MDNLGLFSVVSGSVIQNCFFALAAGQWQANYDNGSFGGVEGFVVMNGFVAVSSPLQCQVGWQSRRFLYGRY